MTLHPVVKGRESWPQKRVMHCEWLGPWLVPGWRSLLTRFGLPPSATVFLSSSDKEWAGKLRGKRMEVTISECAENARLCEWYASRVENEGEKKVFRRMAKHWQALAAEREHQIRAFARATA
jgi:hypothetical protein